MKKGSASSKYNNSSTARNKSDYRPGWQVTLYHYQSQLKKKKAETDN